MLGFEVDMPNARWLLALLVACGSDGEDPDKSTPGDTDTPTLDTATTPTPTTTDAPPDARDDRATVDEGGAVGVEVTDNDVDPDLDLGSVTLVDAPEHGTATVTSGGRVDYQHDGGETETDRFTYTVADAAGNVSAPATVDLEVAPVDDPFLAEADAATVDEGGTVTIDVIANDLDPDDELDLLSLQLVSLPLHGTARSLGDGTFEYVHDGSEESTDAFAYRIRNADDERFPNVAVTVTILPVNDAPTARNDFATPPADGGSVNLVVLGNDQDPDDGLDPATVLIVTPPLHGTATPRANGTVDYQHDGLGDLVDSFTYTVADVSGVVSNVATASMVEGCDSHPQWMPVQCATPDWVWSRDRSVATDVATADANQLLATGCAHASFQPETGEGLCSLDGTGWVSVDQFTMAGCDADWYHLGGYYTGDCGGHDGDLYRHLVLDPAGCYDY